MRHAKRGNADSRHLGRGWAGLLQGDPVDTTDRPGQGRAHDQEQGLGGAGGLQLGDQVPEGIGAAGRHTVADTLKHGRRRSQTQTVADTLKSTSAVHFPAGRSRDGRRHSKTDGRRHSKVDLRSSLSCWPIQRRSCLSFAAPVDRQPPTARPCGDTCVSPIRRQASFSSPTCPPFPPHALVTSCASCKIGVV